MLLKSRSYSEKSNWVELIVGVGVGAFYLNQLQHLPGGLETHPFAFAWLVGKVIVISIVLAIILGIAFGLAGKKGTPQEDERDISIRRKSTVWSYWCLYVGIMILMIQVFINAVLKLETNIEQREPFFDLPLIDIMFHGLIILTYMTQIMQNSLEIFFQRRGY